MKPNNSELERQERKLKHTRWYQILMSLFLITALIFIVCWAITFSKLKAQERLRGDFRQISLVIRLTKKSETLNNEGEQLLGPEETFALYAGPELSKEYYGKSLGYYLKTTPSNRYFQIDNSGFLRGISGVGLPNQEHGWRIISYSESDVDEDHYTRKGLNDLLLDRVNIFVFQLQI